jgi:hypothetical protein
MREHRLRRSVIGNVHREKHPRRDVPHVDWRSYLPLLLGLSDKASSLNGFLRKGIDGIGRRSNSTGQHRIPITGFR